MNSGIIFVAGAAAAYLLGAIPFGFLVARARGVDIRTVGSGNIGATNVFRNVGKKWGVLTFMCDVLKGFVAVFLMPLAAAELDFDGNVQALRIVGACAAIAGHNWPVYLGFKGGKGVATSAGVLLGLGWQAMLVGLGAWTAVFLVSRYVSVASIAAALVVPAAAWLLYAKQGALIPAALTAFGFLAIWRHKSNIRRLMNGTEHRFEFGKKKASE